MAMGGAGGGGSYFLDPSAAEAEAQQQQKKKVVVCSRESAMQSLNSIIQVHFERTLEKKHAIDKQKKHLHGLFHRLLLFLALSSLSVSPQRLQCRHCWAPVVLLSLAHLLFYASAAHTLRCVNGLNYQRRCHKLTLALATDKLRLLRSSSASDQADVPAADFEICYQEPPEAYLGKFKRTWAIYFAFFLFTFAFMVSATVVILCF